MTADPAPALAPHESRLVTISAAYGAGGSVVAPGLAQRLGVPFLQRMTTAEGDVADSGPCAEQLTPDEASNTPVHRLFASLTHAMPVGPTQSPLPSNWLEQDLRSSAEAGIRRLAVDGEGVILGRAAAVVLGKDLGLRVRLDGPPHRRAAQGAVIEGIGEEEATARMQAADKARTAYVRRLYRVNPADASLYHLVIDSTAIPLEAVTEIILQALSGRSPVHAQRR
ncbi:MAG: cytidylate kinase-like family protein [Streptosporangiaceae bacterium]